MGIDQPGPTPEEMGMQPEEQHVETQPNAEKQIDRAFEIIFDPSAYQEWWQSRKQIEQIKQFVKETLLLEQEETHSEPTTAGDTFIKQEAKDINALKAKMIEIASITAQQKLQFDKETPVTVDVFSETILPELKIALRYNGIDLTKDSDASILLQKLPEMFTGLSHNDLWAAQELTQKTKWRLKQLESGEIS